MNKGNFGQAGGGTLLYHLTDMDAEKNAGAFEAQIDLLMRVIELSLNDRADGTRLAGDACLSRFHFLRLFSETLGETPGRLRRRLLLERAAYLLLTSTDDVTTIAFDSDYTSLEGFSRAFRRGFGISPRGFRSCHHVAPTAYRLRAANGVHYDPTERRPLRQITKGTKSMDITDRLIDHDAWMTRRLLERARELTDAQLDAPLILTPANPEHFEAPGQTLRAALERLIFTKETWSASVRHRSQVEETDVSLDGLVRRMEAAFAEFTAIVKEVRDDDRWDETFIDAICVPAETFTYGGMIAHVVTYSAFRRMTVLNALSALGVKGLGYGDPIEWERSRETGAS